MRTVKLGTQVEGINLMRQKGGASPGALFDLKNGWVTAQRTIKARPGTVRAYTLPAGSVGMVGFEGKLHVFASSNAVTSSDPNVVVDIVRHPTDINVALTTVHRAFAFLGRLYVVAEFADGVVKHYWIETPGTWQASHQYKYGDAVQPVVKNGLYYEMLTPSTVPAWQANEVIANGDARQPQIANGFKYVAGSVTGTAPVRTSNTEPVWPTTAGGTVIERHRVTEVQAPDGGGTPSGGTGGGEGGSAGGEYGPFPPGGGKTSTRALVR